MKCEFELMGGVLTPYSIETAEWLGKQPDGKFFNAEISSPRNYIFHKKFFALLNATFPYWKPRIEATKWGEVEKCSKRYRQDLTILAGYYKQNVRFDGSVIIEADSISFAKMDEENFEVLYNRVLDIILRQVLVGWTIEQVDHLVGSFL